MRARYGPEVWAGPIVYLIALLGTWLLANDSARAWAVLLLIVSAVLAVLLWGRQKWIAAFSSDATAGTRVNRSRSFYLHGLSIAVPLVLAADLRYAVAPNETFGLTGILWIAGIALLLCSAFLGGALSLPRWPAWEIALLAILFFVALLSRVWNLKNFPNNIYPDEIMTGTVATQSYVSPITLPPSVFSTLWSGIDLPALWFWFVAIFLKLGGVSLAMLRLPAALFGTATVVPLYALLRGTWGRYAAIAGSIIMAFSASNVHYSRLALNNIVTQFFWATCFFFLLRALRSRRPSDWALAGLSAGLSEYFYYGTRLLPLILAVFMVFLLVVHWKQARYLVSGFLMLAGGYFVGFGPLLVHFIRNPNLYLSRGASLLIWSPNIPISFGDLHRAWKTIWPVLSESLKSKAYRSAQQNYEVQTAQSRYLASLGPDYQVFTVGQRSWPYDTVTTRYLVRDQKWTLLNNPATELAFISRDNKGLAFLFFPGNEQYQQTTQELFPHGKDGDVTNRRGKHLFYTYVLTPPEAQATQK